MTEDEKERLFHTLDEICLLLRSIDEKFNIALGIQPVDDNGRKADDIISAMNAEKKHCDCC